MVRKSRLQRELGLRRSPSHGTKDFLFPGLRRFIKDEDMRIPDAARFLEIGLFDSFIEVCSSETKLNRVQGAAPFLKLMCRKSGIEGSVLQHGAELEVGGEEILYLSLG